mgnify:CR=1 FL=1
MSTLQLENFLSTVCEDRKIQTALLRLREEASSRCQGGIDFAYIDSIIALAHEQGYQVTRLDLASENTQLVDSKDGQQKEENLFHLSSGIHRCMVAPLRCGLAGCNQLYNSKGNHVTESERQDFLHGRI